MSDNDLLAQARKKLRGAARAYGRTADSPGRDAAIVELERAALVAVIAAAKQSIRDSSTHSMGEVFEAAQKGLGL